jgi:hypothetical protein
VVTRVQPTRRGITLFELLLVLTLLVVFGSMVAPVFMGGFSSVRLRRAGDQVLAHWSKTRALAIETGDVYQFAFTPESGEFRIEPWTGVVSEAALKQTSASSATSRAADAAAAPTTATDAAGATKTAAGKAEKEQEKGLTLPEQAKFYAGQIAAEDPETGERKVVPLTSSGDEQSTAIMFFPDGTTSQASVVLTNDRQQYLRLTLRSLTGVGRASQVLTRDELERVDRSN